MTGAMNAPLALLILAAGRGSRMVSDLPKVLHPLGGRPLIQAVLATAQGVSPAWLGVVVGAGAAAVVQAAHAVAPAARIVVQDPPRGTGDALIQALPALADHRGDLGVMFGDTPHLTPQTLARLQAARAGAALVCLGFETADPGQYGRLVLGPAGVEAIVEARDATPDQLRITTCNAGVMLGDCALMCRLAARLTAANAQGEYYLTDLVALARAEGHAVAAVLCPADETLGINTRAELAAAEAVFQARARAAAMAGGATLVAPDTVFLSHDTVLGRDVLVEPHVVFAPGVRVGPGARIRAFSHLEGAEVAGGAIVGPYARLRPGARIGAGAHIGNFVEIKNAAVGAGAKINHLSYVGDASVGSGANLGAGTITCNYDGVAKHHTAIGAGAFIGVHAALVAPVSVGAGAYVATGTVVTEDVAPDALAIARAPQTNREGAAARLRARLAKGD